MSPRFRSGLLLGACLALAAAALAALAAGPPAAPRLAYVPPTPAAPTAQVPGTPQPTAAPTAAPLASPAPSPTPAPELTAAPEPTALPPVAPQVTAAPDPGLSIGRSVQGRDLVAHRIGQGPLKVVLVGDIHGQAEENTYHLARRLAEHFLAHPEEVPPQASLWIVPTLNPDGLATGHRWNANDVDLNRNADTTLDGCAGNDWSPDTVGLEGPHPGAGGAYPFSEPETRALRDFTQDAVAVVFYHSAAGEIYADACQRHLPSERLAEALAAGAGYPVPPEGWAGYPITGDFADYLAGEGIAAVTVELTDHADPEFERNLSGVRALLAGLDGVVGAEAHAAGGEPVWLDGSNTGTWRYPEGSFLHPLALEVLTGTAYLLDAGRVLALDLAAPSAPRVLLAPGDAVDGVRVLEPLDLASDGRALLALDRAGDLYAYDPAGAAWSLLRYGRPSGDTYDHYYVAVAADAAARFLLDTSHELVWRFTGGQKGAQWAKLPQGRDVDLSAAGGASFVLARGLNSPRASLLRLVEGREAAAFRPAVELLHPRQVLAAGDVTWVLDQAGRRALALDPERGALRVLLQFTDRRAAGAVWAAPGWDGSRLLLAGQDALYFYGEPERNAEVPGEPLPTGAQPHDLALLEALRGLAVPIEGATVTKRDFQMPGAPRHYRLGVHEGIDFYGHTVGVPVDRSTPVRAVADGVVVRALLDYQPLTAAQSAASAEQCRALGYTPPEVLDVYRGRQVWIEHAGGLVSRYAHLGSIAPGIAVGARVQRGQVIATVGNSGTPDSVRSQTVDVHLHLELWLGDHFVGQFLRPIEAREWIERLLR